MIPVVDMRRGEVAFELPGEAEIHVAAPQELIAELNKEQARESAYLVGDGALRHEAAIRAEGPAGIEIGDDALAAPDPVALGLLAREHLHRGELCDAFALAPSYLRQADVQINWTTRGDESPGSTR